MIRRVLVRRLTNPALVIRFHVNKIEKIVELLLQIVKWTTPPKMPECYQRTPKQLILTGNSKVLTMTLDTKGRCLKYNDFKEEFLGSNG